MEQVIHDEIRRFVLESPDNRFPESDRLYFDEPLVGFASAAAFARQRSRASRGFPKERRNTMDKKEEYREKLEAQLKEWKAKIDTLETRGTKFTAETKNDLMREIEELRRKKGIVKDKWNELQKSGGDSWDTMKEGVEKVAADLKHAMERVLSRFK